MSPELKRRFKIWGICLLIVIALASIVFVIRVARTPSEPFVSVNFARTNVFLDGTDKQAISIELTNRMSFNVNYWIETKGLHSGLITRIANFPRHVAANRHYFFTLAAHSQTSVLLLEPLEGLKVSVLYERQPKLIELSILNKSIWLPQPRKVIRRSFPVYEWKEADK